MQKKTFKIFLGGLCFSFLFLTELVLAGTSYKVQATDTLTTIIKKHYKNTSLTNSQLMIGLLAENPHAFKRGNINALKNKQVLNIPDSNNLKIMDKKQSVKLIAKHHSHFKKRHKKTLAPPFVGYVVNNTDDVNALIKKQQATLESHKKLDQERDELLARVEKLLADQKLMDAELKQLDEVMNQE